jgi:hypothetical protein
MGHEPIHRAVVPLAVDGVPAVRNIRRLERGEAVRLDEAAVAIGLAPAGRRAEARVLDLWGVPEVVVERAVLLHRHDDVLDRGRGGSHLARLDRGLPDAATGDRNTGRRGSLQERSASDQPR